MSFRLDLVGHKETADEFYATDPEYKEAAAEVREAISSIHNRVFALDIEGTLACTEIGSWAGRGVDFHDRVRRPLANEFAQALIESKNQVVVWTGLGAASACGVTRSAGLKIFKTSPFSMQGLFNLPTIKGSDFKVSDQAELVGRADYRSILRTLVAENHPFAQRVFHLYRNRGENEPLTPDDVAYMYASSPTFKIPSALGADVLIDDAADFFRYYGVQLYGPKEGARYLALEAFRMNKDDPFGYLKKDRTLLEIARKLPATLAEIDGLSEINIEDAGRMAVVKKTEPLAAAESASVPTPMSAKPTSSVFMRFLLRLVGRSR